jgi:hypothetical protein
MSGSFAADRRPPALLFVTTDDALGQLAPGEAAALQRLVPPHRLVRLPPSIATAEAAMELVRPSLADPGIEGVVLLGDYRQVPSRVVRAIDDDLRACLIRLDALDNDADRFYVWNDDIYGDRDGDAFGLPELPVSRVQSGPIAQLLVTAGRPAPAPSWDGIRGGEHHFAQAILDELGAANSLLVCPSAVWPPTGTADPVADRLYIVLHGEKHPGSVYHGRAKGSPARVQAMNQAAVPECFGTVVFAASCYGGLIVDDSASRARNDPAPVPRTAGTSIALRFIENGARAFVGFTAVHWSTRDLHLGSLGAPLHTLFWRKCLDGLPPAKALFEAKAAYIGGSPRPSTGRAGGKPDPLALAIEMKTYWSATCLGLGW